MKNEIFKALKYRNYRLYFTGQTISLVGTWMQRMAVGWLIYKITGSAFMLGLAAFAGQVPTFIFSPYAGVIVDNYDRYKILLITQVLSMIQASVLTFLVLSNNHNPYIIIFLSFILGVINSFDTPSRQSLVVQLVDKKEDLPNAIALNSSMLNIGRLMGPAVAGIILLRFGEGFCFLINSLSFIAVITSLLMIKIPKLEPKVKSKNFLKDFKEGYRYLRSSNDLKRVILTIGALGFLVMPYNTLIPVFAKDVLKGDASTFGVLNSFTGLGALFGAIFLAIKSSTINLKKIMILFTFLLSFSLIFISLTTNLYVAMGLYTLAGLGMMTQFTVSNTIIQTTVDDNMRGRVSSFYLMAVMGMQPFGSFFVGSIADTIGAQNTVLIQGVLCSIIGILYFRSLDNANKDDLRIIS